SSRNHGKYASRPHDPPLRRTVERARMFEVLARLFGVATARGGRAAPPGPPPVYPDHDPGAASLGRHAAAPPRDTHRLPPGMGPIEECDMTAQAQTEAKPTVTRNQALGWLRQMLLIRRFEERSAMLYQNQKIAGFCHLYSGQESVAVGSIGVLREDDYVITA